ncbi:MAG: proprotein convertase P-domain-containing protein [Myxococcales bacterium]|nr:proprotein convertase P-domain-containing protein [Myxococcales bacterium]
MSRWGVSLVALAVIAAPRTAMGDELNATLSQPLAEVSHSVDLRIEDGTAIYVVRRTFANPGGRADEAQLDIDLPMGAAVTGLRIRARDRWYDADLMEADEAAQCYHELTSMGAWQPKDPALLQWVWADRMHLQVFPVLPAGTSTVEYTLTAPLHYREGRYVLSYPRAIATGNDALALATPVLRVDPGHGDATTMVRIDGAPVAPDTPVVLGPPVRPPWIGEGEPDPRVGYAWSRVEIDQDGSVRSARVSLDLDHTYRGDLRATLVTPAGTHIALADFEGSDNDVSEDLDVELPEDTEARGTWHLLVSDHAGLDVGTIDAWSLKLAAGEDPAAPGFHERAATDLPVFIPDAPEGDRDEGLALIEIAPGPIDELAARYGRVEVDADSHFLRLELEVAPELQALPRKASVVFVVDASRSVADDVLAQLRLARAYMAHVPDAEAEVVLFRRKAERIAGDFLPAEKLWAELERAETAGRLELGNGSALEEGLRVAGRALRGRAGPKRIVLLTDARLRSRFALDDGLRGLELAPRDTVAHLVVPGDSRAAELLERDDGHPLAPIPAASGGVLFGLRSLHEDKALEPGALALVRPIAIDDFSIDGVDLTLAPEPPEVFAEGTSYGFMIESARAPGRLLLHGKIWGRDFRRVVRSSRGFGDATAAFVFSEDEHHDLSPEQMMKIAMRGRAVSPVTSYLAVEPGVRPSTIGIEGRGAGGGGSGEGTIGLGGVGLIGKGGGGGGPRKRWTLAELMAPGVEACVAAHHPAEGWGLELAVETTSQEIVDVQATGRASRAMTDCVVEVAWAVELTWNFEAERLTRALSLP